MDNIENDDDGDYSPNCADELSESGDDEATMEEEENLESDGDVEDEINALQQEQDLPIEDLIKLYGYSQSGVNNGNGDVLENAEDRDNKGNISEQVAKYFESDESDVDDDYIPNESWKKEIRVGPDYQADVPDENEANLPNVDQPGAHGELVWDPNSLEDQLINEYLTNFYRIENGSPKPDNVVQIPDDETALKTFYETKYDQGKALDLIKNFFENKKSALQTFTDDEATIFEDGLKVYGKNFYSIQKNLLTQKSVPELVRYYYYWKKTERHDEFVKSFRFEKRRFHLHPNATDFADHFLDNLPGGNVHNNVILPEVATAVAPKPCGMMASEHKSHQGNSTHYNLWKDIEDRHENHGDSLPIFVETTTTGAKNDSANAVTDVDELPTL